MTLEERCRLSYYKEIADISTHKNVSLVQHAESRRIYVKKEQMVYNRQIYEYLMKCNNPHIPKIYECVEDEDRLIIIEEYIQGDSLLERLKQNGVFDKTEVCRIVITICDVLEQLHHLPIPVIHRDLKPENILIQDNGYLKIIDFNTAKQFEEGRGQDTVIIGTREFAAPEQYGFAQSDARTDIYAIGVMMNFLLTGEYPRIKVYGENSNQSQHMIGIIKRCIALDPGQRYQTVMDLRKDLQAVLGVKENKRIDIRDWHIFLPPGFRTGRLWKMLIAMIGYAFIFWCGLSSEFSDSNGVAITGIELWANRFAMLSWMLVLVFLYGDYMGIQKHLPMGKGRIGKWIACFLWSFAYLFVVILWTTIFTS